MKNAIVNLAVELGYAPDSRLIIIVGDELGECHAANVGIMKAFEAGLMTSASLMMPCPWVMEAVEYVRSHPGIAVGVHLTLSGPARGGKMRWRPLCSRSEAPGLYAPDGYMWPTGNEMWKHASPAEVKKECCAQIEKALALGIDVTHLDGHDGVYSDLSKFGPVYGELAEEFGLPLRMPSQERLEAWGHPKLRAQISQKGVLMSDDWIGVRKPDEGLKEFYLRRLQELAAGGFTDIWTHPAVECDELKACAGDWWKDRVEDLRLFTEDRDIRRAIEAEPIVHVAWREIRDLQRSGS